MTGPTPEAGEPSDEELLRLWKFCWPEENRRGLYNAGRASRDAEVAGLVEMLSDVHELCLYAEDDGVIGVTLEPTLDSRLFDRISAALKAARGGA